MFLSDAAVRVVVDRFAGDELISMWGEAVDERRASLAAAYAAAIAEKCVRLEIDDRPVGHPFRVASGHHREGNGRGG